MTATLPSYQQLSGFFASVTWQHWPGDDATMYMYMCVWVHVYTCISQISSLHMLMYIVHVIKCTLSFSGPNKWNFH